LVDVVVLPIAEAEALVLSFRLQAATRRSSLEEGWLLRELVETHGMTQPMLAVQLRRSKSWVSRRLALVQVLPASAQQAVRNGLVPPQAAMKYLVPLARDNRDHCERLVTGLSGQAVTVREAQRLYAAWRAGDDEQRERIVDHPHLFLKADQAVASTPLERDELDGLLADLEGIAGLCRRARGRLREGVLSRANGSGSDKTGRGWLETRTSFDALVALMEAEGRHASA
jgi:hypothetical protein